MAGLIAPQASAVALESKPSRAMTRRQIGWRLAFLPQRPSAPEEMSVAELVAQGCFAHLGLFSNLQRGRCGGESQRAWIAAALVQEARVLLLDESARQRQLGLVWKKANVKSGRMPAHAISM